MAIYLIDKIKQKNGGTFKLVDASDINWDIDLPGDKLPDTVPTKDEMNTAINTAVANAHHLKRQVVDTLPEVADADPDTIYMVPSGQTGDSQYDEYILVTTNTATIYKASENVPMAGGDFDVTKVTVLEGSTLKVGDYLQDPRGYYNKVTAVTDTTVTVAAKDDGPFNTRFEKIGNSAVDLTDYVTKEELTNSGNSTLDAAKKYADDQDKVVTQNAATDAQTKADAAKDAAVTAAATDATTKANAAKTDAITAAAADAQTKADAAKDAAIAAAATDAQTKADAAKDAAVTEAGKNTDTKIEVALNWNTL